MRSPTPGHHAPRHAGARGFTLVELLVALFVLALMAVLSWRGLDAMVRTQAQTQERSQQVQVVQIALAQWTTDLDALVQLPQAAALDWNGRVLRLTRTAPAAPGNGVVVVAWARRADPQGSRWMRWQSPPVASRAALDEAWQRADAWSQAQGGTTGGPGEATLMPLADWQIFYFRNDAWTNPLSSDATGAGGSAASTPAQAGGVRTPVLPDGVRLVLSLPAGQALAGEITRDWVRPTVSGGKQS